MGQKGLIIRYYLNRELAGSREIGPLLEIYLME